MQTPPAPDVTERWQSFAARASAFGLLQLALLAVVLAGYRVDRNAYFAAFADKHRHAAGIQGPRLIMSGGSNVAFSTDSTLLARELRVEPVNLSLQHSIGLRFMLREALDVARSGDTVVLFPEYGQYDGGTAEPLSLFGLLEQAPEARRYVVFEWELWKKLADNAHLWLRGAVRADVNRALGVGVTEAVRPYSRDSFDRYGDIVAHWTMPAPGLPWNPQSEQAPNDEVLVELAAFADALRARGAKVYLFHPAIPRRKYEGMHLEGTQVWLDRRSPIEQLNRIEEMVYPDELFFDAPYHLTRAGVERRTALLVERLAPRLSTHSDTATPK